MKKYLAIAQAAALGAVATLVVIYVARKTPVVGPYAQAFVTKALNG